MLISDVLCQLCEQTSPEITCDNIEFDLTLLQLVNEGLRLPRLLLELSPLIDHLLEFYKYKFIIKDETYHFDIWDTCVSHPIRHSSRGMYVRT